MIERLATNLQTALFANPDFVTFRSKLFVPPVRSVLRPTVDTLGNPTPSTQCTSRGVCGPSLTAGNTYAPAANCTDPRSTPLCGSLPSCKGKGAPSPRRSPRAPRYISSRELEGNWYLGAKRREYDS
jgi:hypothetical protein